MPSRIIVTAADAGFFDLLRGLVTSMEVQRGGQAEELAVFDLGLTGEQRAWLEGRVMTLIEPEWDLEVPARLRAEQPHLRGLTVRPFLPRYFPGYDIYFWIDADVWLQDWRGVELYTLGASRGFITVASHSDRAYPQRSDVLGYRRKQFHLGYGKTVSDRLFLQQHMNAGIFAVPVASPLWGDWAGTYQEGIDASAGEMVNDQIALNVACFRSRHKLQVLPAIFNWQCHLALPMWDPQRRKFCEPMLPHLPISLLHLTHKTKDQTFDIRGLDGRRRLMSLRAPQSETPAQSIS